MVPEGYRARVSDVSLNTGAWHRKMDDESGSGIGDAYTGVTRVYKWVVEPIPEAEEIMAGLGEAEWNEIVSRVSKRKYPKIKSAFGIDAVDLFVPHGDLQTGQGDGDSVEGMIARMGLYPVIVKAEIARLKKTGTPVKRLVCPSLGDLVEGTVGFYANSLWLVKLNNKKQRLVARRVIQAMLEELATLGLPILVPVVPGNHGENRNSKGKITTDTSDNSDLEVMEVVAEILRQNPTLKDQIEFRFVDDGMETLTIDLGWGYGVGFTHGHLSGHGSGHPAAKMTAYLKGQALAEQAIGPREVHHLRPLPLRDERHDPRQQDLDPNPNVVRLFSALPISVRARGRPRHHHVHDGSGRPVELHEPHGAHAIHDRRGDRGGEGLDRRARQGCLTGLHMTKGRPGTRSSGAPLRYPAMVATFPRSLRMRPPRPSRPRREPETWTGGPEPYPTSEGVVSR